MKISTHTLPFQPYFSLEDSIKAIAKAGFDAVDISLFNLVHVDWAKMTSTLSNSPFNQSNFKQHCKDIKQLCLDNGIVCNQTHSPFPTSCKTTQDNLPRFLEISSLLGAKCSIVHPLHEFNDQQNAQFYSNYISCAKDNDIIICAENMYGWNGETGYASPAPCSCGKTFLNFVELVNSPYLKACVDIGHAEMKGLDTSAEEMILTLGHHVKALHIHDNDKVHDNHWLPFLGNIDFEPIVKALKKINYDGYFTLECDNYLNTLPNEKVNDGVFEMAKTARKLANMFDQL